LLYIIANKNNPTKINSFQVLKEKKANAVENAYPPLKTLQKVFLSDKFYHV